MRLKGMGNCSMAGEDGEGVLSEGAVQSSNVSRSLLVDPYLLRRLRGYLDQ